MLGPNFEAKIGDFGVSKQLDETVQMTDDFQGTPSIIAPELWEQEKYSFKSDIWSLGCVLYQLCTFKRAFHQNDFILHRFIKKGVYKPIPEYLGYSSELIRLIDRLLTRD